MPVVSPVRTRLLDSPLGVVDHLRSGNNRDLCHEGFSPEFQVCLPTGGLFVWHVGDDDVIGDPNHALFVTARERYRLSQPLGRAYAELIITPHVELLAEAVCTRIDRLSSHPLFRVRRAWVAPDVQRLGASFLRRAHGGHEDRLAQEEAMVALVRSTCGGGALRVPPAASTRRLIQRTKEHLEEHLANALHLTEVARAVSASPAYLTSVFRRFEGVSLHKYVTQLRLARSLTELPHAADLTTVAVNLGFSSHSHFASAFRSAFGMTPSDFRRDGGPAQTVARPGNG